MTDVAPRSAFAIDPQTIAPPSLAQNPLQQQGLVATASPSRGFLKSDAIVIGGTIACVGGVAAVAHWLPSELALAGSAILAAAAAGIAAARIFTSRSPQGTSLAVLAGMAGIAAITVLGSVGVVNHSKNETLAAKSALVEQVQLTAGERVALEKERGAIAAERQALIAERAQVQSGRQELLVARETFKGEMAGARGELDARVKEAAEKLVAPDRAALQAQTAALEAERKGGLDARMTALAAEAKSLSVKQLAELTKIVEAYQTSGGGRSVRFVGTPWAGNQTTTVPEQTIGSDRVLATLVTRGEIYAGSISANTDTYYVVTKQNATKITTVAQLLEFLRLHTTQTISP